MPCPPPDTPPAARADSSAQALARPARSPSPGSRLDFGRLAPAGSLEDRLPEIRESDQRFLAANLVRFCRALRRLGFAIGPQDVAEALRAVETVGVRRREDVYVALRSLLVRRADQIPLFDEAFRLLWREAIGKLPNEDLAYQTLGASVARMALQRRLEEASRHVPWYTAHLAGALQRRSPDAARGEAAGAADGRVPAVPDSVDGIGRVELVRVGGYSPLETLRRKDFGELTPPERSDLERFMRGLVAQPRRFSRRLARAPRGSRWDLAASARRALKTGGELLRLAFQRRRRVPRPVVLLLDVSGSMEAYSRPLLAMAHGMARRWGAVEVFVFGTRLTRLTRQLARTQPDRALAEAARRVADWAGGTRIGQSLREFNRKWARRALRRGAIVIVVSDGWDRGDIDVLRQEMERLWRFSRRLVWVNPLLGRPGYAPLTAGMQAALPYIDDLVGVSSFDDLQKLARWLVGLSGRRPARAQRPAARVE